MSRTRFGALLVNGGDNAFVFPSPKAADMHDPGSYHATESAACHVLRRKSRTRLQMRVELAQSSAADRQRSTCPYPYIGMVQKSQAIRVFVHARDSTASRYK